MFGVAIAVGNAFILKPSERDRSVPVRLAELFLDAGAPEGILQLVHGDKEMVDAILDSPAIPAIRFVGSSDIAHLPARCRCRKAGSGRWAAPRTTASSRPMPISARSSTN
jgi:acyl-CoA reductase-like NAD-dependent aldehyde dehydrogenase